MNPPNRRPTTVEDILRLKRAERPPPEFWERFDRELRAKQLAALVAKQPWWRTLPRTFAGLSRFSLPLGATAALAITFVVTRDFGDDAATSVVGTSETLTAEIQAAESAPVVPQVANASPLARPGGSKEASVRIATDSREEFDAGAALSDASASLALAEQPAEETSPSARHIAANLAAARAEADLAGGLLVAARAFEEPAAAARPAVEPLAQISTPAERSRARFATAMVASYNSDARWRTASANVARRISDERVYDDDAIRRVGATGNSVAWRF